MTLITPPVFPSWIGEVAQTFAPSTISTARLILLGVLELDTGDCGDKKSKSQG